MNPIAKPILLAALALAVVSSPASARSHKCPSKPGTLAVKSSGRIWHQGSSLYGCTTVYDHVPKAKRLGPYKAGTKVAFDGDNLAWTVPLVRDGVTSDRLYAVNVDKGPRWMLGRLAVPAANGNPEHEARVQRLVLRDRSVAWATADGDLVWAMREPGDDNPTPFGTVTSPLKTDRDIALIASFPDADPAALASSLDLQELEGDGDECGALNPYTLRAKPDAAAPALGADWSGYWQSTNCS